MTDDEAGPELRLDRPGDHYLQYTNIYAGGEHRTRRAARHLHAGDLSWTFRRFEPPPGYDRAQVLLEDERIVVVSGAPGTGMRTAATMLLRADVDRRRHFQELSTESHNPGESYLDGAPVEDGDLLLLDLGVIDAEANRLIQDELPAFRNKVRAMDAKIVVIENRALRDRLAGHLRQFRVELGRPNPIFALRRHLAANGFRWAADRWPHVPGLDDYLRTAAMRQLADFADLAVAARTKAPSAELGGWLEAALAATADLSSEVDAEIGGNTDGRRRALLLATAMLEGAPAPAVLRAAEHLVRLAQQPADETPVLERQAFPMRLRELKASVDADSRVWFDRLGYAPAVVAHFWHNRFDLRDTLRQWVEIVAVSPELDSEGRDDFAERAADQCLRVDRPDDVTRLATAWLRSAGRGPDASSQAFRVLRMGLLNDRSGHRFRRALYDWAGLTTLTPQFAAVLIRLCAEVLAPTWPDQALTRLHRMAKRDRRALDPAAVTQLLVLLDQDDRLLGRMLQRLRHYEIADRWRADVLLFLEVVTPERLTGTAYRRRLMDTDAAYREHVVGGWRDAMSPYVEVGWQDRMRAWLSGCLTVHYRDQSAATDLLAIATEAAAGAGRAGDLYLLVREWSRIEAVDRPARARLSRTVVGLLDVAQGVGSVVKLTAAGERSTPG